MSSAYTMSSALPTVEVRYAGLSHIIDVPLSPFDEQEEDERKEEEKDERKEEEKHKGQAQAGAPTTAATQQKQKQTPYNKRHHHPNIFTTLFSAVFAILVAPLLLCGLRLRKRKTKNLHVLDDISGVLPPGTSTLIISAPGGGGTTLLRLLSGRLRPQDPSRLLYNGQSIDALEAAGVSLGRLAAFTPETDFHEPLLTVKETLEFASAVGSVSSASASAATRGQAGLPSDPHSSSPAFTAQEAINILGLGEAENTIIGSESVRGISGGQKRRVSVGESLIGAARLLCLDSPTSGLDAATAFRILKHLTNDARKTGGVLVTVLQQPSPEMCALFDSVVLLADGKELYHGPWSGKLEAYLYSLGFIRPRYMDLADYASELVTSPERAAELSAAELPIESRATLSPELLHVAGLAERWKRSEAFATLTQGAEEAVARSREEDTARKAAEAENTWWRRNRRSRSGTAPTTTAISPILLASPWAARQYRRGVATPPLTQGRLLLTRQVRLVARDKNLVRARLINSTFMGVVLATLFLTPPISAFQLRFGLALYSSIFIGFTNTAQVPAAISSRVIVWRHTASGWYSPAAFVTGLILATIPLAIVADIIYGSLVYWPTGWAPEASRYFFYLLTIFLIDMTMASYLRLQAFSWPSQEVANAVGTAFIAIWLLTAGFYVIRSQMPVFLAWLTWVSPFFWAVTAMTNSEFHAPRYSTPSGPQPGAPTTGQLFMQQFDYPYSNAAKWGGIIFLFCAWIVLGFIISPLNVGRLRYDEIPGTVRARPTEVGVGAGGAERGPLAKPTPAAASAAGAGFLAVPTPHTSTGSERDMYRGRQTAGEDMEQEPVLAAAEAAAVGGGGGGGGEGGEVGVGARRPISPTRAGTQQSQPTTVPIMTGLSMSKWLPSALPFPPVTLAFENVGYSVQVPAQKKKKKERGEAQGQGQGAGGSPPTSSSTTRVLLRNIFGYALPGTLTCLMGATGAGKTTLADVIAGRKTTGSVSGSISLNGEPASKALLARVTAYAEQEDIHHPLATVREALAFSHALRYRPSPPPPSAATVRGGVGEGPTPPQTPPRMSPHEFIDRILRLLELGGPLESRLVNSLSRGERKRLTIGVELAASPSLLFCDEPTSLLSSRDAAVVMRVLRRVANTGRTVVCTIHQPSAAIFFSFDALLLLAPGGRQIFFGPLGHHACHLINHLSSHPGVPPLPEGKNPAAWMLEVIENNISGSGRMGAGVGEGEEARPSLPPDAAAPAAGEETGEREQEAEESPHHGDTAETTPRVQAAAVDFANAYAVSEIAAAHRIELQKYLHRQPPTTVALAPSAGIGAGEASGSGGDGGVTVARAKQPIYPPMVPLVFDKSKARSFPQQLWLVYVRANRDYWRNGEVFTSRMLVNTFLGLLFGLLFLRNDPLTFAGVQSTLGFCLSGAAFAAIIFLGSSVTLQFERRAVFYRERSAQYYSAPAYSLTAFLVEIPYVALAIFLFVVIAYWLAGLRPNAGSFFFFYLSGVVLALWFLAMGTLFAAAMPSLAVAQITSGLSISAAFLFGGLFISPSQIPAGWIGLYYAVPTSHTLRALAINQFFCLGGAAAGCPQISTVGTDGKPVTIDRFKYVTDYLAKSGVTSAYLWGEVGWAALAAIVTALAAAAALQFINWQRR